MKGTQHKQNYDWAANQRFLSFEDPLRVTWTLPEQIANELAEKIIRGVYAQGQRLQEVELAKAFDVSRGPIREALRVLEKEGFVTIQARRGAFVTAFTAKDIRDIFEVRSALYGVGAAELARHRSSETLAILDATTKTVKQTLAQGDVDRFLAVVYRMSMYLAEAPANAYARKILFSLGRLTLTWTRKVLMVEKNRRTWAENWSETVKNIREGNPNGAEKAVRHLVDTQCARAVEMMNAEAAQTSKLTPVPK